jgi:hypothetical protein
MRHDSAPTNSITSCMARRQFSWFPVADAFNEHNRLNIESVVKPSGAATTDGYFGALLCRKFEVTLNALSLAFADQRPDDGRAGLARMLIQLGGGTPRSRKLVR